MFTNEIETNFSNWGYEMNICHTDTLSGCEAKFPT